MAESWMQCFVGLGSNLHHPLRQLQSALQTLRSEPRIRLLAVSPFYRSVAIGPAGQPDYCNAVAGIHTDCQPLELLDILQGMEARQGRDRQQAVRWGPRSLDLDLLLYGDAVIDEPRLTVPHPEMHKRVFVMRPLADIAPDVRIPGLATAAELAAGLGTEGLAPWPGAEAG